MTRESITRKPSHPAAVVAEYRRAQIARRAGQKAARAPIGALPRNRTGRMVKRRTGGVS